MLSLSREVVVDHLPEKFLAFYCNQLVFDVTTFPLLDLTLSETVLSSIDADDGLLR